MGKIETGIILHDNFTNVIYGIISSVNLAVSAVYDMQQAMNTDVDMAASLDGAREDINQATVALYELENAALALDGTKIGVQLSIPQNEKLPEIPSTTTVPVIVLKFLLERGLNDFNKRFKVPIVCLQN